VTAAAAGVNGLSDPVEPGLACGSDTAHMNIFGYDPRK
jgi:2,3-bisphosphoglycerate-independent phosphoglycerate mutase